MIPYGVMMGYDDIYASRPLDGGWIGSLLTYCLSVYSFVICWSPTPLGAFRVPFASLWPALDHFGAPCVAREVAWVC